MEEGSTGFSPCSISPSVTCREGKGGAGTFEESPGGLSSPSPTSHLWHGTSSSTTLLQTHPFHCGHFRASNTWDGEGQEFLQHLSQEETPPALKQGMLAPTAASPCTLLTRALEQLEEGGEAAQLLGAQLRQPQAIAG